MEPITARNRRRVCRNRQRKRRIGSASGGFPIEIGISPKCSHEVVREVLARERAVGQLAANRKESTQKRMRAVRRANESNERCRSTREGSAETQCVVDEQRNPNTTNLYGMVNLIM